MKIRTDIADMLRAGHTHTEIRLALHVSPLTVQRTREALKMPPPKTCRRLPGSPEEAFHASTEPVDGGHLRWTGYANSNGSPRIGHGYKTYSAYAIAFRIRHDRAPVGRPKPGCDYPGCIAPDHVEDRPMRERNRAAYDAIFGRSP